MDIRRHLIASLVLSVIGTMIGAYLVWVHYNMDALVCGTGECEIVQTSSYSTVMDVPIAWLGTAMYLALLAIALLRLRLPDSTLPLGTAALAITAAGTLYSGWLTWVELYVIDAICHWCVASAVITTLLFVIEILIYRQLWAAQDDGTYLEDADFD